MSITSELTAIKENISDGVVANKVSRFAYKEQAYTNNDADGTDNYNVNQDNNIPLGTASAMKVNQTVIELGWRARASSITRMLMNHFLGRVSYNLNKANDMINSILNNFITYLGTANGVATLDSNALVPSAQLPKSNVAEDTNTKMFTAKGAFDYTLGSVTGRSWLYKVFGWAFGRNWAIASGSATFNSVILNTVVHSNSVWVATANSNGIFYSYDGKTWSQVTGGIGSDWGMNTAVYANGLFVVSTSRHGFWWSEDGVTWTPCTGFSASLTQGGVLYYANGLWLANLGEYDVGQEAYWSTDGKSWTPCTGLGTGVNNGVAVFYYANGLWVCSVSNHGMYWSNDGKSWTQSSGLTTYSAYNIVYANGIWVTGQQSLNSYWSADGKVWVEGTGDNVSGRSVSYANGMWFLGNSWSTDGKVWTAGTGVTSPRVLSKIYYANGLWLGMTTGTCFWSEDGKKWTGCSGIVNTGSINDTKVYACIFFNGVWLLGANDGCWWSLDGKTYIHSSGELLSVKMLVYKDGLIFAGGLPSGWCGLDLLIEQGFFTD